MRSNDVLLHKTVTLGVWIRRPRVEFPHWWLVFCSSRTREVAAWNHAIEVACKRLRMAPFHQTNTALRAHRCDAFTHEHCEDTAQGWELWMPCSEVALEFPNDPIEDILECGDPALRRLLDSFDEIKAEAERLTASYR